MISARKIRFILKRYKEGQDSAKRIRQLAKVSKSTYYRVIGRFAGVPTRKIRDIVYQRKRPGRPVLPIPLQHIQLVMNERLVMKGNDRTIARRLNESGVRISHCKVYEILKSAGMIHMLKDKRKRKKWVRWERKHSLSLWQTDWTALDKKYLIVFMDDASRLVVGWGLFDNATSENSVKVLKEAISKHGKPKAMLTGRDAQFYSSIKQGKSEAGETAFQLFMRANGIKHILARVNHPQTCGKIERFFGEVKKRMEWRDFSTVGEIVRWHNEIKPHMSLSSDEELITPAKAFVTKLHHNTKVLRTYAEVR